MKSNLCTHTIQFNHTDCCYVMTAGYHTEIVTPIKDSLSSVSVSQYDISSDDIEAKPC